MGDEELRLLTQELRGSLEPAVIESGEVQKSRAIPLMMHPENIVERSGTPPAGTRILNGEKLEALKATVLAYATALAYQNAYLDEGTITEQLRQHKLLGGDNINAYSVAAKREARRPDRRRRSEGAHSRPR